MHSWRQYHTQHTWSLSTHICTHITVHSIKLLYWCISLLQHFGDEAHAFWGLEFCIGDFYHVCCLPASDFAQIITFESSHSLLDISHLDIHYSSSATKFELKVENLTLLCGFCQFWLGLSCKVLTGLQFANCCHSECPAQLFAKFFFEDAVAARFWEASSSFDFSKFEQAGYERDAHWLIRPPKMPQHWNCQFRGRRRRKRKLWN